MNKNYKKIILSAAILGLVAMALFAFKVYATFFSPNTNFTEGTYEVKIPSTADYNEAFLLVADAVEDRDAFHTTAVQKGYHKNVKPGRYILKPGMSNNDIINTIRSQNVPVKIRFNNQERLEDLSGRIAQQIEPDSITLLNTMRDPEFLNKHGFKDDKALTMYYPNSYEAYAKKLAENNFNQVIKRVLFKDLELDSKYNTYKYATLPPGPITTPDLNAIDAVLNYEKHDYFYFVADVTNPDRAGYHKFAKTLAQHNSNAAAYRRWVNQRGINR